MLTLLLLIYYNEWINEVLCFNVCVCVYVVVCCAPSAVKPLYGIASDSVLFYGLQRAPYISAAAGVGIASFSVLAAFQLPLIVAALSIFGGNLSVSSPDVMIDAIVAQQCKYFPMFASVRG